MKTVQMYMFVPGKIENWIFVIDTCNKGLFSIPIKAVGSVIGMMQLNFAGCLHNLLILNPSSVLKWSWGLIEKFIDAEAAGKIRFLSQGQLPPLPNQINSAILQKKYGGSRPDFETGFWPPDEVLLAGNRPPRRGIQSALTDANLPNVADARKLGSEADPYSQYCNSDEELNLQEREQFEIHAIHKYASNIRVKKDLVAIHF